MSTKAAISLLTLAALAAGILLWRPTRPASYVNLPPRATGPWVALGDSLTAGYGAADGQDYPTLLAGRLGVAIPNLGVHGHTSADGLALVDEVAQLQPRVVLLCLGGNDVLHQQPRATMITNLASIIDRLHQAGSFVVLIGVRGTGLRDKNEAHFRTLARNKQVLYVPDILRGVFLKPIYMADAVHPNDEGYARIAERLEQVLKPWLPRLEAR